ncbi:MAG: Ig-like domain-containing protein, partial [Clostridia bacterium]|nr:Ig-like domain-containing protein [Clostridia bacterium]
PSVKQIIVSFGGRTVRYFGSSGAEATASDSAHPVKLTMCGPADFSKNAKTSVDATAWENCSSVWYVFEYAGKKLLFTGDTYPDDLGTTYTYGSLSGTTAVDYMLKTHSSVVSSDVYFLECNHHSRIAYVENLFNVTQPVITVGSVSYGLENPILAGKAVTTSDFYLAGDGQNLFAIDKNGNVTVEQGSPAYSKNEKGKAIRNYVSRRNVDYVNSIVPEEETVAASQITLTNTSLTLEQGETASLYATVLPGTATSKIIAWSLSDSSIASFDGDTVTANAPGTTVLTVKSGSVTASCSITVKGAKMSLTQSAVSSGIYTLKNGYFTGFAIGTSVSEAKALFNGVISVTDGAGKAAGDNERITTGYSLTNGWDTVYAVLPLDVDGNGKRTVSDYLRIKRAADGTYGVANAYKLAADLDGDGNITINDVQNAKLYFKGIISL